MPDIQNRARGFWKEFQSFAVKGNVVDLAIAVVVGNAFSAIVSSLVADIITPLLSLFTGNGATEIKNLSLTLRSPNPFAQSAQPLLLHYGSFLQTIINFFVISLSIFLFFKIITSMRQKLFREGQQESPAQKPAQERLLEEIRDLLKDR
ncbi:MAG: large conductance mechanosensitive channel [Patescibacteria group bacterium]|jgi:large conductance mechanosensitive channel|nr:large conductance mechanosensitive channel [Patescibacteria group bacterium]